MAIALSLVALNHTRRYTQRTYKLTVSGNYTNSANGTEILNLATATNALGIDAGKQIGNRNPIFAGIVNDTGGLNYEIVPGATPATWSLKIWLGTSPPTEVANNVAYGAGNLGTLPAATTDLWASFTWIAI